MNRRFWARTRREGDCLVWTDRIITAPASEVSGAAFYEDVTGRRLKTKAEKEAEWQAEIERHADAIERGSEWAVPPPCLWDARKLVEKRLRAKVEEEPLSELKRTGTGGFWL